MNNLGNVLVDTKKGPVILTGLLSILLITTFMFTLKAYEPANNIIITGGIFIYPFTFLIISLISKYYGFKEARSSIFISSLFYILFFVIIMICVLPNSSAATSGYNTVIMYLFTNKAFTIGNMTIAYPILGQFLGLVFAYVVSHLIYATVYNAIRSFTVDYLAVGLGLFIGYIIDRILFMPILYAEGLSKGYNTFEYFIKCLTSEFIFSILACVILVILYVIITSFKNLTKKS